MTRDPKPIARRLPAELLKLAAYGAVFAVLAVVTARLAGYQITALKRGGSIRGTSPADLGPRPVVEPLADDFAAGAEIKNVILLFADGLGPTHVVLARSELVGLNGRLAFERMPISGWFTTHEAGALITDSAAAATALFTGRKTDMGRLSTSPDGQPQTTVMEAARDAGMVVGAITDTYLWDATPAALLSHVETRKDTLGITDWMARSGAELLVGELTETVSAETDDGRAVLQGFADNGYAVARTWEDLQAIEPGRRIAALLDPGTIPDPERSPGLPELAELALERLAGKAEGFFLLVEVEETDTAAHYHQVERFVAGVKAIDEVATLALDFARRDRSTLVLLIADHETGGLSLLSGDQGEPLGLRWTTGSHSGGPVPLYAYGPGARRFSAIRDNTEFARILADLLGLEM